MIVVSHVASRWRHLLQSYRMSRLNTLRLNCIFNRPFTPVSFRRSLSSSFAFIKKKKPILFSFLAPESTCDFSALLWAALGCQVKLSLCNNWRQKCQTRFSARATNSRVWSQEGGQVKPLHNKLYLQQTALRGFRGSRDLLLFRKETRSTRGNKTMLWGPVETALQQANN